jgi:hypothetical protein
MSKYVRYYNANQRAYRDMAIKWMRWAEDANLSDQELKGISKFFYSIARRFGLITEFRSIGVI